MSDRYDALISLIRLASGPGELAGVLGGGGGVGAAGRGVPDQDAGFGLTQVSALGLLAPIVMTTRRTMAALTDIDVELGKQSRSSCFTC